MPSRLGRRHRPPAERQPCDCAALAAQNAELRSRHLLFAELVDALEQRRQDGYALPDRVVALLDRIAALTLAVVLVLLLALAAPTPVQGQSGEAARELARIEAQREQVARSMAEADDPLPLLGLLIGVVSFVVVEAAWHRRARRRRDG